MIIIDAHLKFTSELQTRKETSAIVLHHTEWDGAAVENIHELHKSPPNNWSGIGYNFYIRKDGSIYKGRGWDAIGAHAGSTNGYNPKSIGIAFEGRYNDKDREMPPAQYYAGVALISEAIRRYGVLDILKHSQTAATDCPGKFFPFDQLVKDGLGVKALDIDTAVKILAEKNIITSPDYWRKAAGIVNHLDSLLIKMASAF